MGQERLEGYIARRLELQRELEELQSGGVRHTPVGGGTDGTREAIERIRDELARIDAILDRASDAGRAR